jgi:3-hydroxyisobutyrate dehydrogenase-like beta-hydroxyacid dehydrogenase
VGGRPWWKLPDRRRPSAVFLYGGKLAAFQAHRDTLAQLGGSLQYLGPDLAMVTAAYSTIGVFFLGACGLFYESAAIASCHGIPIDAFYCLARIGLDLMYDKIRDDSHRIAIRRYGDDQDSVDLVLDGLDVFRPRFRELGIPMGMFEAFMAQLEAAKRSGRGGEDISCIHDVLLARRRAGDGP